jgi:putative Mn2+ efflux pump MntP
MDAFSVAIVTGFGLEKIKILDSLKVSLSFGLAHVFMPIIGWSLGFTIVSFIQRWDHWVAFFLLAVVGGRMIREGLDDSIEVDSTDLLGLTGLLFFSVAVSIDALTVGLSFSLQNLGILIPSLYMGSGTLLFTFIGLNIGNKTGQRFGRRAQIVGGIVLILIGLRIIFTHIF